MKKFQGSSRGPDVGEVEGGTYGNLLNYQLLVALF
jgi:hypothetical protein